MARSRHIVRVGRPAGRANHWIGMQIPVVTVGANVATLVATFNAAAKLLRPFTIIRTRCILNITSDQVVTSEFVQGAFGMQVVTDSAAAAGVASVPTPLTETDADFFVYQPFINSFLDATSVGFFEQGGQGNSWLIDSKAMRKVGTDDDVAVTCNDLASGYNLALEGRMLVKLH